MMWLEWNAPIFRILLDSSLRTFAVALIVVAILFAARVRSSHWQHRVWTIVLFAMIAMPLLSWIVPPVNVPYRVASPAVEQSFSSGGHVAQPVQGQGTAVAKPLTTTPVLSLPGPDRPFWPAFALIVYGVGVAILLIRQIVGWVVMTGLACSSRMTTDVPGGDVAESDALSAPLMCGILRPRVLLPLNWKEWSPSKLRAVLVHERAHIRRGDALVGFLARLNCAIFWFHPVAWWLERKLATLAEQACDDEVVKRVGEPRQYAEVLLEVAEAVSRHGGRVSWQGVGVVGKGNLRCRIERLLREDIVRDVSVARKAAVAVLCMGTIYLAAACRSETDGTITGRVIGRDGTTPVQGSDEVAQLRQEIAELRNEIRRLGVRPGTVDPNSRNPFHVPDVPNPDGADVKRYAPTIDYLGKADDPNAEQWVMTPTGRDRSSIDGIDGEWVGRWNNVNGRWVPSYKAEVKSVGDRVYIFYRDHQGRFLADLHREKDLLVGRLVGIDNPADSSLCVVRIVGADRLDGVWDAGDGNPRRGRLDFRRRFK